MKIFLSFTLLFLLVACDMETFPEPEGEGLPQVLVYCDIALLQPVKEIAAIIEKTQNCEIVIISSNAGHLLHTLEINHEGDIYFPGCSSYLSPLLELGVVTNMMAVGYNIAGFIVWPENPKEIAAEFLSLLNPEYKIAIASHMVGSIGRDTKRALVEQGIYAEVVDRALFLALDSQELVNAITNKDVDLVVNWLSTKYLPGNGDKMEFLPFPPEHQLKHQLIMGQLLYSKHPEIVSAFFHFAITAEGKEIFRKYGFRN